MERIRAKNFVNPVTFELEEGMELSMLGYSFNSSTNSFRRTYREGKVVSIKDYVLEHTITTGQGFSGAPIFFVFKGKIYCVGMHIQQGYGYFLNSRKIFHSEMESYNSGRNPNLSLDDIL